MLRVASPVTLRLSLLDQLNAGRQAHLAEELVRDEAAAATTFGRVQAPGNPRGSNNCGIEPFPIVLLLSAIHAVVTCVESKPQYE